MKRCVQTMGLVIFLSAWATTGVAAAGLVEFTEHHLTVTIRAELKEARIEDQGRLVCGQGTQLFCLRDSANIERFMIDGRAVKYTLILDGDSTRLPAELRAPFAALGFDRKVALVLCHGPSTRARIHRRPLRLVDRRRIAQMLRTQEFPCNRRDGRSSA